MYQLAEPRGVLAVPGVRHPHRLAHAGQQFRARRLAAEQGAERIARRRVQDAEHHQAHAEQQQRRYGKLARECATDGLDGGEFHDLPNRLFMIICRRGAETQRNSTLLTNNLFFASSASPRQKLSMNYFCSLVGINHSSANEKNLYGWICTR